MSIVLPPPLSLRARTSKIPPRHVVVALALSLLAISVLGWTPALPAALAIAAISSPLVETDLREQRLPNRLVFAGLLGALCSVVMLADPQAQAMALFTGASVGVVLLALSAGGLGMGDVKLGSVLAAGLGVIAPPLAVAALACAFVLGGFAAVTIIATKGMVLSARIPFGPPLLAGYWLGIILSG